VEAFPRPGRPAAGRVVLGIACTFYAANLDLQTSAKLSELGFIYFASKLVRKWRASLYSMHIECIHLYLSFSWC